jgi:hypothetical protein
MEPKTISIPNVKTKKMRIGKKILFVAGLGMVIALFTLIFVYNKPHRNIESHPPDYKIEAKQLAIFYNENEQKADSLYLGKLLQVEGVIASLEELPDSKVVVLKGSGSSDIRCNLAESQDFSILKNEIGAKVNIKGVCIGVLLDVNLNNCFIIIK